MWHAAKDHLKINEGEGKEIWYGSIVKRSKTPAFHVGDTGSNPVGATIYAQIAQLAEHPLHTRQVVGSNPTLGTTCFHFISFHRPEHVWKKGSLHIAG